MARAFVLMVAAALVHHATGTNHVSFQVVNKAETLQAVCVFMEGGPGTEPVCWRHLSLPALSHANVRVGLDYGVGFTTTEDDDGFKLTITKDPIPAQRGHTYSVDNNTDILDSGAASDGSVTLAYNCSRYPTAYADLYLRGDDNALLPTARALVHVGEEATFRPERALSIGLVRPSLAQGASLEGEDLSQAISLDLQRSAEFTANILASAGGEGAHLEASTGIKTLTQ